MRRSSSCCAKRCARRGGCRRPIRTKKPSRILRRTPRRSNCPPSGGRAPLQFVPMELEQRGRRRFLQTLAGAAVLGFPPAAWAQAAPSASRIGDRITLITGAGNNVVALAGDAGSLLVDAGDAAHVAEVLKL